MKKLTKKQLTGILKKYNIYFSTILITFIAGEFYPFSFYPMYNHFPNWSYTFYFEDENNNNIKHFLVVSHGSLSHLFYSACQRQEISYGYGQETDDELQSVGERISRQALYWSEIEKAGFSDVKLYRIHNYMTSSQLISDTLLISVVHVE